MVSLFFGGERGAGEGQGGQGELGSEEVGGEFAGWGDLGGGTEGVKMGFLPIHGSNMVGIHPSAAIIAGSIILRASGE